MYQPKKKIRLGTLFSGIGAIEQAFIKLNIDHKIVFACDNGEREIKESKEELFNLRFQQATGTLEKPSRIRELRHTVARLKTVLREREINE